MGIFSIVGTRLAVICIVDACRFRLALVGVFKLNVVILSLQRLVDLSHVNHHVLFV